MSGRPPSEDSTWKSRYIRKRLRLQRLFECELCGFTHLRGETCEHAAFIRAARKSPTDEDQETS